MSATMLQTPKFFSDLAFARIAPPDDDGRVTFRAPCGCEKHMRVAVDGPLRGHFYGDVRAEICDQHCRACAACGQMQWPHNDCRCD